jgi:hypothetical protein
MKRSLIALAALAASASCFATYCPDGSTIESHPNNDCSKSNQPPKTHTPAAVPTTSTAGAAAGAVAGAQAGSKASATGGKASATGGAATARQQQAQRQAQAQRTSVTGVGQGAGALAGAGAGSDNGNGNGATVSIDAADRSSSSYRATSWAPVIHGESAAPLANAGLIALPGVCGPRVRAVTTQVIGVRFGFFGGQSEVNQGYTQELGPEYNEDGTEAEPFIVDGGNVYGHRYTILAAALGTSSANSISVGGFRGGDAAQGGVASSGGMQQIGTRIVISRCVYATVAPPPPLLPLPAREPKVIYRTRWRDRPVAVPVATPCCVAPPVCCTAAR